MYSVYVLQSDTDGRLYTGSTSNIRKRVRAHNAGYSLYTSKFRPWRLVWCAAFVTRVKAEAFERYLKSGSGQAFFKKRLFD